MSADQPNSDGLQRCPWALATPEYVRYHDEEWGRPVHDDDGMYERIVLEAFQAGLSWLTILRKRDAFRAAFGGFSIAAVSEFGADDVRRLLADPGIIRNRAKIEAAITNARAAAVLPGGLAALVWSFAPAQPAPAPRSLADVPASSEESRRLAKELKRHGFVFVGATTAYATMQAAGLVDDHLTDCWRRGAYQDGRETSLSDR